jgi:hypothetical protein
LRLPGQAVTLWFVVCNYPEFCASRPCRPTDIANPNVKFDRLLGRDGVAAQQDDVPDSVGECSTIQLSIHQ